MSDNKDTSQTNALARRVAESLVTPQVANFRQVMVGIYQAHKQSLVSRLGSEAAAKSQLASVVMYIDKNPKLMECTPHSLWECISNSVSSGFWPVGFPPMAYYVPFRDNKSGNTIATFIPHYNAYVTRMFETRHVRKIMCKVVWERDEFTYVEGSDERIIHRSFRGPEADRGRRVAVYCITVNEYGLEQITVLWAEQVEGIRSKSRAKDSGPWSSKIPLEVDWMWMKSAVRQHRKLLPSLPTLPDYEDERDEDRKGVGLAEINPFAESASKTELGSEAVIQPLPAGGGSVNVATGEVVAEPAVPEEPNI